MPTLYHYWVGRQNSACGSAHYWARESRKMGHDARLMPPQFVKPYVKSGKAPSAPTSGHGQ